jgi:hypothetical protein
MQYLITIENDTGGTTLPISTNEYLEQPMNLKNWHPLLLAKPINSMGTSSTVTDASVLANTFFCAPNIPCFLIM